MLSKIIIVSKFAPVLKSVENTDQSSTIKIFSMRDDTSHEWNESNVKGGVRTGPGDRGGCLVQTAG